MKKILITVPGGFIARNILRSGVLDVLKSADCEILLAVPESKREEYKKEFEAPGVRVLSIGEPEPSFIDRVFAFLARNGIKTETVAILQQSEYAEHKRFIIFVIKRVLRILGGFRVYQTAVRFFDNKMVSHPAYRKFLEEIKPDLVFATNVIENMDIALLREARRLGIKIAGMAKSWDNLTNHGVIRVLPPQLIVHNPFLKMCAMRYHFIPENRIKIVGIPHYDWYVNPEILKGSREEFLRSVGLDPTKKFILIAGIGDFLAPHEWEIAKIIDEAIEKGGIPERINVLFRPHPNFMANREKIIGMKNIKFDDGVARYSSADKGSWEMGRVEIAHLINSLRYADLVINIASSITIDAAAFDRPVICVAFDGESKEPYWNSVARFYTDFTHYKLLTKTGGFKLAYNPTELIQYINDYLKDPQIDADGRKKIFDDFIWKLDGRSAERLVESIIE